MLFPTLMSKTFFILAVSLVFTYLGAQMVLLYFRKALEQGKPFVTVKRNKHDEEDLVVEQKYLLKIFWPALILSVVAFFGLLLVRETFPLNMGLMALYTFIEGVTLGIVLISMDENLAIRVAWLTAVITLAAGVVGLYSETDLMFLGPLLFWALIGLIVVSFVRLFVSIKGGARRIIALIGVLIFVGYLLYDFNRIRKIKNLAALNTWNVALDSAIDIYLDIINLFLQLLDLLSDD